VYCPSLWPPGQSKNQDRRVCTVFTSCWRVLSPSSGRYRDQALDSLAQVFTAVRADGRVSLSGVSLRERSSRWLFDQGYIRRHIFNRFPVVISLAFKGARYFRESVKPIELLVLVSFTHCCASTPSLSTWWSSTALRRDLVSRGASHLDAFSGYPFRT
jgi:hypothetical protein